MQNADYLLRLMKQRTDALVASDEKLQQFLIWVNEKSLSVKVSCPYKALAIRVFYFVIAFARDLGLSSDAELSREFTFVWKIDIHSESEFDIFLDFNLSYLLDCISNVPLAINLLNYNFRGYSPYQLCDIMFALNLPVELRKDLESFQFQEQGNHPAYKIMWWQPNKIWTKRLRKVMIQHRNIGHDWHFNQQQKDLLKEYYDANKLLVDCLNSSNLSPEVRNEIEETLLLPIAEIEQYR